MREPRLRMIFCDVDGTLLKKGESAVSQTIFETIRRAHGNGLRFVVASGRTYTDLKNLFFPVKDIVTFVSNDGALAVDNEKVIYSAPIDTEFIGGILKDISLSENEKVVACLKDRECSFSRDDIQKLSYTKGEVYKLAFYKHCAVTKEKLGNRAVRSGKLSLVYSDREWTEYIKFRIDKGSAAEALQKYYGVTYAETVAFGDNINDLGMLRRARVSVAAPDAIPAVKRVCKYCVTDVADAIFKIIEEGEKYE